MRKIKLVPGTAFYNECEITVFDVTEGSEKKRCKVTAHYGEYDLKQLRKEGLDYTQIMNHYKKWLFDTVKYYILDDWQCIEGMDKVTDIISNHVKPFFD